ncbi:MAG: hypothetical protein RL456_2135, partial [Pseudomonadota bacterium]
LARIAQRVQRGEQVSQADLRLLQSVQASDTGTAWPDRESCAAELTADFKDAIRVGTLYEWVRRGAPIPRAGPIPKLALYRWLACEKRLAGRPVGGSSAPSDKKEKLLERQIQQIGLKVNTMAGAMVSIDDAALVIDTAVEDLKTALRHDLPPKAAELVRAAGSEELAVEAIREVVDTCLGSIAAAADQYRAKAEKAKQTLQDAAS